MQNALIGYTGFVGCTLLKQHSFNHFFRSTNIDEIRGRQFDLVVCAGAPAQKWIANKDPESDLRNINQLINHIRLIDCKKFVLISTVDVFNNPVDVNEDSIINESGLHPYGLHRFYLENFVRQNFKESLIVRLPGLVGPGLRKNVIFDLKHKNNIQMIDSRNIFQFYPMVNLWKDISCSLKAGIPLIHLTAEPISVKELAQEAYGMSFEQQVSPQVVTYDMQTKYAELFGGSSCYQYSKKETILATRSYIQSEPQINLGK